MLENTACTFNVLNAIGRELADNIAPEGSYYAPTVEQLGRNSISKFSRLGFIWCLYRRKKPARGAIAW